ncbi:MAG TPA: TonB-dependent receptor [Steroidobacteraceae bacterium]|nr:TonB-dependent receptor [Steroidobacteraceae bacterium]
MINRRCAAAVAAILGTRFGLAIAADDSTAGTPPASEAQGIQEVTVTAQRRTENVQNVPIAIQAFTSETLQQLNVTSIDELMKYLPNVSGSSAGPGQTNIFMRGLSTGDQGTQSGGSINGFPNVAIYLDEQSGQLPGRNLDVYAADLERIEVLEGPQGTLFGAGAQAGVIRYITNKPQLNVTSASVTAGYGTTAGGDPNANVTAVVNLPVIADTLAVRGVIYDDHQGGYINNVPATFTRENTDIGIHYANYPAVNGACPNGLPPGTAGKYPGYCVPPDSPVINNYNIAANAINPVDFQGIRVSALWDIREDWTALVEQSYQDIDAQGVFYQMPNSSDGAPLPPQSVTLFNPSYNKDKFENTALTLNGRIADLRLVYAGSYLVRNISQIQDYTNYARGVYADYYQCHGAEPAHGLASACYSPATTWNETEEMTHQSHEIRLSTPDEWRLRGILGAFWEDLRIYDQLNWLYKTLPGCSSAQPYGCLTDVGPPPDSDVNDPAAVRNDDTAFFNDVKRGYTQTAFFTSVDFDIVPKVLTVTAGTRYYDFHNYEKGAVVGSFTCYEAGLPPCLSYATSIDSEHLENVYTGFRSRANLTWHILPDVLAYYTWSQGFRPGAFNRNSGCYIPDSSGVALYCSPLAYKPDNLTNDELGWKTEWLDHRVQWNGAVYQENWDDVQVPIFDPAVLGNVGFGVNGPNYRIRGVETSLVAVVIPGFTLQGAASWNSSTQTNSPYLIANNPMLLQNPATAGEYGKPILFAQNPYGPPGSPSANSPPFQFNARARYQWAISKYDFFTQLGATHSAHSFTQSGNNPELSTGGLVSTTLVRFENPPWTEYDASAGVGKDAWTVQFFAENLTNTLKSLFTSTSQFAVAQTITRPRVLGIRIDYRF